MIRMKLKCTLKLKTKVQSADIAQDINIIELPDNYTDEQIKIFFAKLRHDMKVQYWQNVFELLDVEIKDISEE